LRYADGKDERLAEFAAELVRLKVDVLVTHTTTGVQASKRATSTIPIVIAATGDVIATGLIASLARPGGNVTGSTIMTPEVMAKRFELLKEAAPGIKRVAAFLRWNAGSIPILQAMEATARLLKVEVQKFDAPSVNELNSSFSAMTKNGVNGLVAQDDPVIIAYAKAIAEFAEKHRIPSAGSAECAEAGMLLGYGANILEMFSRAAYFVDRILKGAKPADLPVERPTKFETVINMKTAKALGIRIPNSILVQATKVIE
jgi:putative ABC transport system substrate-binding protein